MKSGDTLVIRKLSIVKSLFDRATNDLQYIHVLSNRLMALIGMDLAVETLLKIINATLNEQWKNIEQFQPLVQSVEETLKSRGLNFPYKAGILHQHSLRNDAQHKGRYPNEMDLAESTTTTRSFCSELLMSIWEIDFQALSLVDLIVDQTLRSCLFESQWAIESGNFRKSLCLTNAAFGMGSNCLKTLLPRTAFGISSSILSVRSGIEPSEINRALRDSENNAKRYAALLATSINPVEYHRFLSTIPSMSYEIVPSSQGVNQHWILHFYDKAKDFAKEDAEWSLNFAINAISTWQGMGILESYDPEADRDRLEMLMRWGESEIVYD
jgi:hypothetical protein